MKSLETKNKTSKTCRSVQTDKIFMANKSSQISHIPINDSPKGTSSGDYKICNCKHCHLHLGDISQLMKDAKLSNDGYRLVVEEIKKIQQGIEELKEMMKGLLSKESITVRVPFCNCSKHNNNNELGVENGPFIEASETTTKEKENSISEQSLKNKEEKGKPPKEKPKMLGFLKKHK